MTQTRPPCCLVRGIGDVGSAIAHRLRGAGHHVAIHDSPTPTVHRRGMAFADAVFDGSAILDGREAQRIDTVADIPRALAGAAIPVHVGPFDILLAAAAWDVLVDARLRKRSTPEDQRGQARLAIGLGPGFVAGANCDVAIETSWENLGQVIANGGTAALAGEPRSILGQARERLVYAPVAGVFVTSRCIGDLVRTGEPIAAIGDRTLAAPLDGAIRGLTRSGVAVEPGTKVIEIDPRGRAGRWSGLGERPARIAAAVLGIVAMLDT